MAVIKRSLSMTSITSASEASPEHGPELRPGDSTEACMPSKASCSPSRHEAKPKSLNLPPEAKHCEDPQSGFKPKTRTPEERLKWPHEQLREYHQHNSPGVGTGATDTKRQINSGSNTDTTTSPGCHSPEDENKPIYHHLAALKWQVEAQAIIGAQETALYFSENAARQLEGDCRYLSGCLQHAS
nr:amyloid beta A4 precursor protein-binding family A member 2-like isoform X2 [Aotus nancymaae]